MMISKKVGRHSLVTPIDWKPLLVTNDIIQQQTASRHSLVTPIDWKLVKLRYSCEKSSRQSPFFGDAY